MLRSMFVMEEVSAGAGNASDGPMIPVEPVPAIESRFLFVDVAALRAKQLRRGAHVRFDDAPEPQMPKKPERVAMEEVRRGLVQYEVPIPRQSRAEDQG